MKLQRSTWTLLGVAVVFGGVVLATELGRSRSPETPGIATAGTALFAIEESDIEAFQLERSGETLAFAQDETGAWQMTEPTEQVANEGTIAFLLNLLATANGQSPQTMTPAQEEEFGLAKPLAIVTFTTQTGKSFQLTLGGQNFNGEQRYAIATPLPPADAAAATEDITVQLVPNTFAAAVDRPLADWQGLEVPPRNPAPDGSAPTPSPSASPEPDPVPPFGATPPANPAE